MHRLIATIRLGKDAEVRFTPAGAGLVEFSGAYDVGFGEKKTSQWVKCTAWREKPETLASYLKKGVKVAVTLKDVHNHTFQGKDGPVTELRGTVDDIDFLAPQGSQSQSGGQQRQQQQRAPAYAGDDMDGPDF